MRIGELAAVCATPIETIRYYERAGLLPAPARSAGNFRIYETRHRERLQFIRYCRGLDMSLDEVRLLLRFQDEPGRDCGDVNALLDAHLGHVSQRIRQLRALQRQLRELRQRCDGSRSIEPCGILHGLAEAAGASASGASRRGSHVPG